MAGTCKGYHEPSGSIKCGEFLDWLRSGLLFKKDSVPWIKYVITRCVLPLVTSCAAPVTIFGGSHMKMPRSGDKEPTLEGSDFDYVGYYLHLPNCNF